MMTVMMMKINISYSEIQDMEYHKFKKIMDTLKDFTEQESGK